MQSTYYDQMCQGLKAGSEVGEKTPELEAIRRMIAKVADDLQRSRDTLADVADGIFGIDVRPTGESPDDSREGSLGKIEAEIGNLSFIADQIRREADRLQSL